MISYYATVDQKLTELPDKAPGCWINMINPTREEVDEIVDYLKVDKSFITSALDEEEASRVETEDGQTLIVVDAPLAQQKEDSTSVVYSTMPLGIVLASNNIVTVSLKDNAVLSEFASGTVKNIETKFKTHFTLTLLLKISGRYLQYLKQIDKISLYVEKQLHRSMRNKELIQLLELEKSLVYFSTSLKANEVTFEKILRGRMIKLYDEDQDLLEDVLVEIKQAIEMANIYSSILSGTMDAFASVISNNLNIVMKRMTSITILMAFPTMIASFYGMNVDWLPMPNFYVPLILSVVVTAVAGIILWKKEMF